MSEMVAAQANRHPMPPTNPTPPKKAKGVLVMAEVNRREFLAKSTAAAAATALSSATVSMVSAGEKPVKKIRIGVIGTGRRGPSQIRHLLADHKNVVVPAICDIAPAARANGVATVKKYGGNTPEAYGKDELDYRNLIARDDIDGVVVVTDCQWLGKISIDALKADKHVGCDVTGTHSHRTSAGTWSRRRSGARVATCSWRIAASAARRS